MTSTIEARKAALVADAQRLADRQPEAGERALLRRFIAELYEHALGPSRDDGRTSLEQHARPAHRGDRGFFQERRAAVEAMQQYFHGFCMLSMFPAKRVGSGACASFATGCPARAEV